VRRPAVAGIVVAVALSVTGMVVADGDALVVPASSSDVATRIDPPDNVLVIGDSAIAALRWVPGATSAVRSDDFVALDLESCRRLVEPSCRGREGRRPPTVLDVVRSQGASYATIVVATGYNDWSERYLDVITTIVREARRHGVRRIIWYTLREDERSGERLETYRRHNVALRWLAAQSFYADLEVAEWDEYTVDRPEWLRDDGVHYTTVGAWAAADYLTRKLAHLDGRTCPVPESPDGSRESPCPDPDFTGPVALVDELYPIGEDGVLCYELGVDRDLVCTSDTGDQP
jgi:hypothetical protein